MEPSNTFGHCGVDPASGSDFQGNRERVYSLCLGYIQGLVERAGVDYQLALKLSDEKSLNNLEALLEDLKCFERVISPQGQLRKYLGGIKLEDKKQFRDTLRCAILLKTVRVLEELGKIDWSRYQQGERDEAESTLGAASEEVE